MTLTFDLWLGSTNAPQIAPIDQYIRYASAYLADVRAARLRHGR